LAGSHPARVGIIFAFGKQAAASQKTNNLCLTDLSVLDRSPQTLDVSGMLIPVHMMAIKNRTNFEGI
jgi:hypothetical protein